MTLAEKAFASSNASENALLAAQEAQLAADDAMLEVIILIIMKNMLMPVKRIV
jgi:hypothetical protein